MAASSPDSRMRRHAARTIPGVLSAAMVPGVSPEELRAIIQVGRESGLEMRPIYEERRRTAFQARRVVVPSWEELGV